MSASGNRERTYHKTREAAKDYAAKLRADREEHGANAASIRPSLAEDASKAAAILEPYGITLQEAARRIVAIEDAAKSSSSIEEALKAFESVKEGKSPSQIRAYAYMAKDLKADFVGMSLADISGQRLLAHVEAHTGGAATYNHRARLPKAFWRWCAKQPRAWCNSAVVEMIEKKETSSRPVGILNAKEVKVLLIAAERHFPECVPGFAIALFTGMRQAELGRLSPNDVTVEGITVPATSAKTGQRRFIEMPLVLAAWLKNYPIADTVLPANWNRKEKAVRRIAGWKVWSDLLEKPVPDADLPKWPENALRHTHASVAVSLGVPLDSLTFSFGHSGGSAMLKRHYVGVMSKAEAIQIWSIGPHGTKISAIQEVA